MDTAILVKNGPSMRLWDLEERIPHLYHRQPYREGLTSAATFTKRRRCTMSDSLCIR